MTEDKEKLNEEKFKRMWDAIDRIERKVDRIQVTLNEKTNSRLKKLEGWRMYVTGGMTIIVVLLVPILLIVIDHWL